ncbi:MAG: hypothetical protein CL870_03965 [Cytophagia bacterium]|nr:hypothetical protein [Cytophagia bacterium]|tara:strand:+ start:542 stop:1147 length:606 start_codon:yes stop_codon:yes gene_type:complete
MSNTQANQFNETVATQTVASSCKISKDITEEESTKTHGKTRTDYISDIFSTLPLVEGFPLTSDQLWEYFNKACDNPHINCRKLSSKKDKVADNGPKRISGYNLFTREFTGEVPQGIKRITHTSKVWKSLSKEKQDSFNSRALEVNQTNGIEPKKQVITYEQRINEWEIIWKQWFAEPESSRGPEPIMPKKAVRKRKQEQVV